MRTIMSIIKHEVKAKFFSWITLIFFLMLVFQGIWCTKGAFDYYINDNVLMNAPAIFYKNFAGLGMLMVVIIAISTGGVLYKDIQYKSAQWIYSLPLNEKQFFLGRFLSAFIYLLIVSAGFFVGMLIVPYSGIGEAHRFGPVPIGQMLHGVLIFLIPNILLYISAIFASITIFRQMAVGYLAVLLFVVLFIVMLVSYESGGFSLIYVLADPSGYVAVENYGEHLTTAQKNVEYIRLTGYVLANRLIWASITIILFIIGYKKFRFKNFITAGQSKDKKFYNDNAPRTIEHNMVVPTAATSFRFKDFTKKLFTLSQIELLNIIRPASFKIILGILLLMIFLQNLFFNANYYIGKEVAISSNMTYFRLPWGVFIVMLLMIWSGELFFKEKTTKIWQITGSLPVPVWVTQLSKLIAAFGLAFILCISFIAIGLASQIIMGGAPNIEFARFGEDILGFRCGFLNFILYICLVFFVAALTGNRFITHIVCVGYFLFTIISFDMGLLEQVRYAYALVPGVEDFSEMSGYGIYQKSASHFAVMWSLLALGLVLSSIWIWNRGSDKKWATRIKGNQLNLAGKISLVVSIGGFAAMQMNIHNKLYANGNFTPTAQQERQDADYEKKYAFLIEKPHPKYDSINLTVDFYPKERKLIYTADITMSNTAHCDSLYLNFEDFVTANKIL